MPQINFQTIDWTTVEKTEHQGETGVAYWQTKQFEGLRVRIVEYSPNYLADHWCEKGTSCSVWKVNLSANWLMVKHLR